MDSWAEEVLAMAKKLPRESRRRIAYELRKIDGEDTPAQEVEAAWRDEILKRAQAVQSGEAVLHDGEEVFARLRAKYAR